MQSCDEGISSRGSHAGERVRNGVGNGGALAAGREKGLAEKGATRHRP